MIENKPSWKAAPGFPARESSLRINDALKLRVYQTTLRSETSDRKFSFGLYQTVNGMRSCLWHMDDVPCENMAEAQRKAMQYASIHFRTTAAQAKALSDAIENAVIRCDGFDMDKIGGGLCET